MNYKNLSKLLSIISILVLAGCSSGTTDGSDSIEEAMSGDTAPVEQVAEEGAPVQVVEETPQAQETTPQVVEAVQSPETPVAENTAAPVETQTAVVTNAEYTVKKGDTLMKISFNLFGDITRWRDLYELNKDVLTNANVLVVGKNLKYQKPDQEPVTVSQGEPYMIKKGDTLGTIAVDVYANKNKWKKLYENNKHLIKDPNRIYAGFYIYYQMTEAERADAEKRKSSMQQAAPLADADSSEKSEEPKQVVKTVPMPSSLKAPESQKNDSVAKGLQQMVNPGNAEQKHEDSSARDRGPSSVK